MSAPFSALSPVVSEKSRFEGKELFWGWEGCMGQRKKNNFNIIIAILCVAWNDVASPPPPPPHPEIDSLAN